MESLACRPAVFIRARPYRVVHKGVTSLDSFHAEASLPRRRQDCARLQCVWVVVSPSVSPGVASVGVHSFLTSDELTAMVH